MALSTHPGAAVLLGAAIVCCFLTQSITHGQRLGCDAWALTAEDGLNCDKRASNGSPQMVQQASRRGKPNLCKGADCTEYRTAFVGFDDQQTSFKGEPGFIFSLFSETQHELNALLDTSDELTSPELIIKELGMMFSEATAAVTTQVSIAVSSRGHVQVRANGEDITLAVTEAGLKEENSLTFGSMSIAPGCSDPEFSCNMWDGVTQAVSIATPALKLWVWGEPPSDEELEHRQSALNFRLMVTKRPRSKVEGVLGSTLDKLLQSKKAVDDGLEAVEMDYAVSALFSTDFTVNQFKADALRTGDRPKESPVAETQRSQRRRLMQGLGVAPTAGRRRSLLQDANLEEAMDRRLPLSCSSVRMVGKPLHDLTADAHDEWLDQKADESFMSEASIASGISGSGRILTAVENAAASALADVSHLSFGGKQGSLLDMQEAVSSMGVYKCLLAALLNSSSKAMAGAAAWEEPLGGGDLGSRELASVRHSYLALTF